MINKRSKVKNSNDKIMSNSFIVVIMLLLIVIICFAGAFAFK